MLPIDISRRSALKLLGAGAAASTIGTGSAAAGGHGGETLFEFGRMRGNQGPLVGSDGEIRGVDAGGLPWVVDEAEAKLEAGGRLKVEVEGLVLDPDDDRVPGALAGTNPVPEFRAVLSCLTINEDGERETVNTTTDTVSASESGNAEIEAELGDLPDPCYAPILFVTHPMGAWFAATGF